MTNFTGVLAEIEETIGTPLTFQIASVYGGTEIYIPKKPTEKMPLVQLIGLDNVEKLNKAFGSGELLIPMGHFRGQGKVRVLIAKMLEKGCPVAEVARIMEVHDRTVRRLKQKNYAGLPLIDYIEEQTRREHEENLHN